MNVTVDICRRQICHVRNMWSSYFNPAACLMCGKTLFDSMWVALQKLCSSDTCYIIESEDTSSEFLIKFVGRAAVVQCGMFFSAVETL